MSIFLVLRYVTFALFICFSSVICVVAALNFGTLPQRTARLQIDSYLIFLGALGLLVVFPVIFVELFRKNAVISRVAVEVAWVALLWVMHLSGAAAVSAIAPGMMCAADGPVQPVECVSARVLLAFTWLATITLLTYLLGLLYCAVHHSETHRQVWRSGVRDYPWFSLHQPLETPVSAGAAYGKLLEHHAQAPAASAVYARQLGLAASYGVEPLPAVARPAHAPVPAAPWPRAPAPALSLYPQHLQGAAPPLHVPADSGSPPPPAGAWPRAAPLEPAPRKQRPALPVPPPPAHVAAPAPPPPAARAPPQPMGARGPPQRVRPPPLDLSQITPFGQTRR